MLKLVIEDDEGRKTTVRLVRNEVTIGRLEGNTIRLTERNVSRFHARIAKLEGEYTLEDLSKYGTRKNGRRFEGMTSFSEGDVVIIGDYRLVLRREEAVIFEKKESAENPRSVPPLDPKEHNRIVCLTEPFAGSEFVIIGDDLLIGRSAECELFLDHPSISRRHARFIKIADKTYRLEPEGMTNKVYINDRDVKNSHTLQDGEIIDLGALKFRFVEIGKTFVFTKAPISKAKPTKTNNLLYLGIGIIFVLIVLLLLFKAKSTPLEESSATEVEVSEEILGQENAISIGRERLENGEWQLAIDSFLEVSENSSNHDLALSLIAVAEREANNFELYHMILRLHENHEYGSALERINELPIGTHYRTELEENGGYTAIREAFIETQSNIYETAIAEGNLTQAREVVNELQRLVPNHNVSLILRELEEAAAAAESAADEEAENSARSEESREQSQRRREREEEENQQEEEEEREVRLEELITEARRVGVRGDHDAAIELLEDAYDLDSRNSDVNLMLFQNYRASGQDRRAGRSLRRYLRRNPNDARRSEWEQWLLENAPEN